MAASGLQPRKIQGRRYTDDATLSIVVRVLTKEINRDIVHQIRELGGRGVGLYGNALQALQGERLQLAGADGGSIDLGRVGQVTKVDVDLISDFARALVIPVIPSLAYDENSDWLNINADTAAAAVASQMRAAKLVMLTDTPGILRDKADPKTLITSLTASGCEQLIRDKIIDSGMIPKVEACLDAVKNGVGKTHIIDGRLRYSLLLEIFTHTGIGTEIVM